MRSKPPYVVMGMMPAAGFVWIICGQAEERGAAPVCCMHPMSCTIQCRRCDRNPGPARNIRLIPHPGLQERQEGLCAPSVLGIYPAA